MASTGPSPIDPAVAARAFPALRSEVPVLPGDAAGPVFKAPWEAQAFAMALALHERGEFSWAEWARTLAEVIGEVRQRGEADTGEDYYRHWLTALERITARKGIVTESLLRHRRREWEEAARRTPHGRPIELDPRAPARGDG
jgi:nitrile hydratase accessory protein